MKHQDTAQGSSAPLDPVALAAENQELRMRLRELEDTMTAIHTGEVDALVVNDDIFVLESANATGNRLRQGVLLQMKDAVFAFDRDDRLIFLNHAAEQRYGIQGDTALGLRRSRLFIEILDDGSPSTSAAPRPPSRSTQTTRPSTSCTMADRCMWSKACPRCSTLTASVLDRCWWCAM